MTDNKTGLVWQQGETGSMTWGSALSYCEGLSLGGNTDWRLPNIKELESITDDARYNPAIDTSFFPGANTSSYWSSTTYAVSPGHAWYVNFNFGNVYYYYKYSYYYVRCVRGGVSSSIIPESFWTEINNPNQKTLSVMEQDPYENKPGTNILKKLPNGWSLKVLNITDENGNNVDINNYRWYKVEDVTDLTIGWMKAAELDATTGEIIGGTYLPYVTDNQLELEKKASLQLNTKEERANKIVEAVEHYYNNADTVYSLYSSNDGDNNLPFLKEINFSSELILAIAVQESGGIDFDNEWVTYDYGHGIMQSTLNPTAKPPYNHTGVGSRINVPPCSLDNDYYKNCYGDWYWVQFNNKNWKKRDYIPNSNYNNQIFKLYSNTTQSIYANIKDGLKVLQYKYNYY